MSDFEDMNLMLGNFPVIEYENNSFQREVSTKPASRELQENTNTIGEDFRSLLITNSRDNSEMIVETGRIINSNLASQMSGKLNEIKMYLNSQNIQAIDTDIAEIVLTKLQNSLGELESEIKTKMHIRPTGLHRNPEVVASRKTRQNQSR